MSEPYVGEIKMVAYGRYAPQGWKYCDGSLLNIRDYQVLYSLLGTQFGGDGSVTFGLPDFRGRAPMHFDSTQGYVIGYKAGVEQVMLTANQIGSHTHNFLASTQTADKSNLGSGKNRLLGVTTQQNIYASSISVTGMNANCVTTVGAGTTPHLNLQPSLTVAYIIAVEGIYPQRD